MTNKKLQSTGKADSSGIEIFVGDKVINSWGSFYWDGKNREIFRVHTIKIHSAHLMANGEIHDDGCGIVYCLGDCYNIWYNNQVKKISNEELVSIGIEEDTDFFFDDNHQPVVITDRHLF